MKPMQLNWMSCAVSFVLIAAAKSKLSLVNVSFGQKVGRQLESWVRNTGHSLLSIVHAIFMPNGSAKT